MQRQTTVRACIDIARARMEEIDLTTGARNQQLVQIPREVREEYDSAHSINLLLSGRTGSGKSTLVNSILGEGLVAPEHRSILGAGTTEVKEYKGEIQGVQVTVWDCPGLQDGTTEANQKSYLQQVAQKCSKHDLTIYAIQCGGASRFVPRNNPDIRAMKQYTEKFGVEFWRSTVIALTFTNTLKAHNLSWANMETEEVVREFTAIINEWKQQVKHLMVTEVGVPKAIADSIPIFPAGHYIEEGLPGIPHWLSSAWAVCFQALTTHRAQASLIKLSEERLKDGRLDTDTILKTLGIGGTGVGGLGLLGGGAGGLIHMASATTAAATATATGGSGAGAVTAVATATAGAASFPVAATVVVAISGVVFAGGIAAVLYYLYRRRQKCEKKDE